MAFFAKTVFIKGLFACSVDPLGISLRISYFGYHLSFHLLLLCVSTGMRTVFSDYLLEIRLFFNWKTKINYFLFFKWLFTGSQKKRISSNGTQYDVSSVINASCILLKLCRKGRKILLSIVNIVNIWRGILVKISFSRNYFVIPMYETLRNNLTDIWIYPCIPSPFGF